MKNKKIMAVFAIIMSVCMTGCSMPELCYTAGIGDIVELADEDIPSSSGDAAILAGESGVTVKDIKARYGGNDTDIAPFYNVSQDMSFIFHFESKVEPACAVTVHTDDSCNMDSMVYQINEGYVSGNGKTDVIVKPGNPVMNVKNKNKSYIWGYAPIYYLCIRYDLKSEETRKLGKPVIVPFTVKSDVSVPNIMPYINDKGQFEIKWNPVDGAVKYNIYETSGINDMPESGLSKSECAYIGDNLKLAASVDANQNTFNDFHSDGNGNTACSGDYVVGQNFYRLGTYYVTAVDKDGKESFFSMAAESSKYSKSLPKAFEDQSVFEKKDGVATVLPDMASIKMCDGKTARFPVSYKKIGEEDGCALYQYSVHGTLLTGEIKYRNDAGTYAEAISSPYQFSSAMYDFKNEINPVPRNIVKTKNTSRYVDAVKECPQYDRQWTHIVYGKDKCYARAGIEDERIKNDGIYPDGKSPVAALTGSDDIFGSRQKGNTENSGKHDSKNIEKEENNHKNDSKEEDDGYKYKIFADSAEEEYLALCIMDGQEDINVQSFPELQNTEYLTDVLYKVIYQNPYIIGIKSFAYDATNARLHITYSKGKKEIKKQQEEIKAKANEIIKSYIKDDMDEEDRVMAIWTYLENNTVYDDEACAAAEGNGFSGTGGYDDSFTAYGVLCKGKGVCQSYMYAMKLLCETAGIECKSLTGYLHNTTPHGWNAVKIDGDWCWIDATNTKQNSGVPYFIYQTSSEFAENSWNYVLDKNYELDDNLGFAVTDNMEHDWYVERGLYAKSYDDIVKIVKDKIKEYNGTLYVKCSFVPDIYKDSFSDDIVNALSEAGYSANEVNYSSLSSIGQIIMVDLSNKNN